MPMCKKCGKSIPFHQSYKSGCCEKCETVSMLEHAKSSLTISHTYSVSKEEISQKTIGEMQPFPLEAIGGYISPSGGYINYTVFQVIGINPKTNRKNKRVYEEITEEKAIARAQEEGFVAPFDVSVLPAKEPSERQLAYAKDLKIVIPDGACFDDVSALITRVVELREEPADARVAKAAHLCGVKFSRYIDSYNLKSLCKYQLSKEDYSFFLEYSKKCYVEPAPSVVVESKSTTDVESELDEVANKTTNKNTKRNVGIGVAVAVAICLFCLIGSCSDKDTTPSYIEPTTIPTQIVENDTRSLDDCPVRIYDALLEKSKNKYYSGLELSILYSCHSTKNIDKVTVMVVPYQYNGEIYDSIRSFTIRGPFEYGELKTEVFKHLWDKNEVKYIEIFAASIYYSDSDVVETYVTPGYIISNKLTKY